MIPAPKTQLGIFNPVSYQPGCLQLIDQRILPDHFQIVEIRSLEEGALAIENMTVRGAPAIGIAAAFAYCLGFRELLLTGHMPQSFSAANLSLWQEGLTHIQKRLARTRPTAVNLFWALERMQKKALSLLNTDGNSQHLVMVLEAEARAIRDEDEALCRAIGQNGAALLNDGDTVLTHCNAGALATANYGTALGVIRAAVEQGKRIKVFADETRPRLQGGKLTAYELLQDGIDVTLICDNTAAWLMHKQKIQKVIVGADRIVQNGDTANKIGTYNVAVLAAYHKIPFYVAAPYSTIDPQMTSGEQIPIEERSGDEVRVVDGKRIYEASIPVINYAFDVTPHALISGIITEKQVFKAPYGF